jgi:hypothetical protein
MRCTGDIMATAIEKLQALVNALESEVALAARGTRAKMQPEKAAELEGIRERVAKLKADLLTLGDLD